MAAALQVGEDSAEVTYVASATATTTSPGLSAATTSPGLSAAPDADQEQMPTPGKKDLTELSIEVAAEADGERCNGMARWWEGLSDPVKGVHIVMVGVIALAPAPVVIRLAGNALDLWTYIVIRQLFLLPSIALCLLCQKIAQSRKTCEKLTTILVRDGNVRRTIGTTGLIAAFLLGWAQNLLPWAIMETTAANVMGILATSPLFAALCSWLVLRQPTTLRLWLAMLGTAAGVAMICLGEQQGGEGKGLFGIFLALIMSVVWGSMFFYSKLAARRVEHFDVVYCNTWTGVFALVLGVVCGYVFADGLNFAKVAAEGGPSGVFWCAVHGILIQPLAFTALSAGARYLLPAQVSLLTLLEIPLAPLLVFAVFGEVPGLLSFGGLLVVVVTLIVYFTVELRNQKQSTKTAAGSMAALQADKQADGTEGRGEEGGEGAYA
ncbi:unnamed protein product [Vitrella brassicaformis CCMP3155]|uniref:EamA domain-containing protein n=2 Tax=Vitrella brassicaformis TaxID=1169539 RepID=A0A0G4GPF3_VITBC|nr:unnamed protein product [Vitrella brassicaformis CCMP3155]|eukprot:CEM32058.1 unnamed protein product [Vitrella brassicaformis CCMP3155]